MMRVTVIGGGTMGMGIAYVSAQAGGDVTIVEPSDARADGLRREIGEAAAAAVRRSKLTSVAAEALEARILRVPALDEVAPGQDFIIESVPEDLDLKCRVLAQAAAHEPGVLASNTSAISISRLANAVPKPEAFLGMHFFNPVWSLKLVELIRGEDTSELTLDRARQFGAWIGKETLVVRDIPGFATSRLDLIASLEAIRMLEAGVASAEDIDRAATLAYRHPVGPLRLSDIVGLDIRLDVARALQNAHGERFAPPPLLIEMVKAGRLGVKSGLGFFNWSNS